jgi:mandelamide amidase
MARDEPIEPLSLLHLSRRFARGTGTARESVDALVAAAERSESNAILALRASAARREAERADADRDFGDGRPLAGVPFLVKANIEAADLATTAGTPGLAGNRAERNAPAVQRLVDAGAIVLGTTNMDELALYITGNNAAYGPIRNPHAPDRIAGAAAGATLRRSRRVSRRSRSARTPEGRFAFRPH